MNKFKSLFFIIFLICIYFLLNLLVYSQAGRGIARISGKVLDEEGNPIQSAKITLIFLQNEDVIRETKSDKKGKWSIMGLGSGQWRLEVSAEGYIPYQKVIFVSQIEKNPTIVVTLKKIEKPDIKGAKGIELFDKASILFEEKKYEEAIKYFQKFLDKNPEFYQIHFNIGNCYKELGEFEKALEEYNIVLENINIDKEEGIKTKAKTLAAIGECYLIKDDLNSAQNYFKKSLELNPKDEILAYNVGEIYFAHQKLDEAIKYYELACQIKSDWSDAYYKLGLVYLNKADYSKAKENFEKFLELEPDTERSANVKNILTYIKMKKD